MEHSNRLHNEISCLGPQGEARMGHEVNRGHLHTKPNQLQLAHEYSELQRVKRTLIVIQSQLETIEDTPRAASNVEAMRKLIVDSTLSIDSGLRELESELEKNRASSVATSPAQNP